MGALPVLKDLTPALSLVMGGITEAEKQRRLSAANFSRASAALEGFAAPDEYERAEQRFINGELTEAELMATVERLSAALIHG